MDAPWQVAALGPARQDLVPGEGVDASGNAVLGDVGRHLRRRLPDSFAPAVQAAMAGRTAVVVGRWHGRFVHVPIELAISRRNVVDPHGDLWLPVLEATGQPTRIG